MRNSKAILSTLWLCNRRKLTSTLRSQALLAFHTNRYTETLYEKFQHFQHGSHSVANFCNSGVCAGGYPGARRVCVLLSQQRCPKRRRPHVGGAHGRHGGYGTIQWQLRLTGQHCEPCFFWPGVPLPSVRLLETLWGPW